LAGFFLLAKLFGIVLVIVSVFTQLKLYKMRSILYLIAVVLVILWILGFANNYGGGLIHILLVIAVIAVLLGIIRRA
jgi:hypothetical protein